MNPARRELSVVLHDVAPGTWSACERVMAAIADVARVPLTLLAVPRYHGEPPSLGFERWLQSRAGAGDEICLHGYTHLDDGVPSGWVDHLRRRHYTRGEGEFSALDADEAQKRLDAGVRWLSELGLPPRGFVAPAWLLSPGGWQALRSQTLGYTCTLRSIVLLPELQRIDSQSLVYSNSAAWRRGASRLWVPSLAALQSGNPLQRLELHPNDADHPALLRSWQSLLERLLRAREPATLAEVVRRTRAPDVRDLIEAAGPAANR